MTDDDTADEVWERTFERVILSVVLDAVRGECDPREYLAFELLCLADLSGNETASLTGLSRNAAYKASRRVLARVKSLVGAYERDGSLTSELKAALATRPASALERGMTAAVARTMRLR